ncbi:MAG: DUF547 domain-containing protein [Bacteroidota bacterium]
MRFLSLFFTLLVLLPACGRYRAASTAPDPPAGVLSQQLVERQKEGQAVQDIVDQLAALDPNELLAELDTREEQLAFWINIYNGTIQYLLEQQPELWDKRSDLFGGKQMVIAGALLSPEMIEHGIIRGTEGKLGLGFIPQLFPSKMERSFKIKNGDPRIHFALNCGAIDCPPVEVYNPTTIQERLDYRTKAYLNRHSSLSEDGTSLTTTPLFSWFKGDFGTYGGIADFLVHFGILNETNKGIKRKYKDYDWTLALDVYAAD